MTGCVGIDPGGKATGVVVRTSLRAGHGVDVPWWRVIERAEGEAFAEYATRVQYAVSDGLVVVRDMAMSALVGVEDVRPPCPHVNRRNGKSVISVGPLLDTARLVGFLQGVFPGAVLVGPGANGSLPLAAYPGALVTDRERAHADRSRSWGLPAPQSSRVRHARSAWDVAGNAMTVAPWAQHP